MKEKIYKYYLTLMGSDGEDFYLDYRQGMELSAALLSGNPPRYVYVGSGDIINTSSIKSLQRVYDSFVPDRELTGEEEVAQKKLFKVLGVSKSKLLGEGSKQDVTKL